MIGRCCAAASDSLEGIVKATASGYARGGLPLLLVFAKPSRSPVLFSPLTNITEWRGQWRNCNNDWKPSNGSKEEEQTMRRNQRERKNEGTTRDEASPAKREEERDREGIWQKERVMHVRRESAWNNRTKWTENLN